MNVNRVAIRVGVDLLGTTGAFRNDTISYERHPRNSVDFLLLDPEFVRRRVVTVGSVSFPRQERTHWLTASDARDPSSRICRQL